MAQKDEDEDEPDRRAESDRDDDRPATRAVDDSETDGSSSGGGQLVPSSGYYLSHPRSRRLSDPSSDRRRRPRRTARSYTPDSDEDEEEDVIEVLPDRFDAQGRPLDGRSRSVVPGRLHSRRGEFEYRPPRPGGGGLNVRGQWGVAGTDERQVERIVRKVTGVVEGRESVLGLLGGLLSGKLLEDDSGEESSGRTKGKRRRREAIEDRYDYDDDRGERRRRRRRGSE